MAGGIRLERNWHYYWLTLLIWGGMSLVVVVWATWGLAYPTIKGESLPPGSSWSAVVLLDAMMLVGNAYLCWLPLISLRAVLDDEGLCQPIQPFRSQCLRWADVTRVELVGSGDQPRGIRLYAGRRRGGLNLILFRDRDRVVDEVLRRLPADVPISASPALRRTDQ